VGLIAPIPSDTVDRGTAPTKLTIRIILPCPASGLTTGQIHSVLKKTPTPAMMVP
jgi:hypothetical protein